MLDRQTILKEEKKNISFAMIGINPCIRLLISTVGENFIMQEIEYVSNYNEREKFWIAYYNSYGTGGYNASRGGEDSVEASRVYGILENHYEDILFELAWTRKTFKAICDKYGFSKTVIDKVNMGEYEKYFPSLYHFPIKHHGNSISHYLVLAIQNKILEGERFSEIQNSFGVGHQFLADINSGRKFKNEYFKYPLRQTNPLPSSIINEISIKLQRGCPFEKILEEYNISKSSLQKIQNNLK